MVSYKGVILLRSHSFLFTVRRIKLLPSKNECPFFALHVSDFHPTPLPSMAP